MVRRGSDRRISKYDPLHWSNLPPGIKVLVAYTGIIALFYLLYLLLGVARPVSVIFGQFFYGGTATLIETISVILLIAIIYGLIKRHFWVFYLSLIWFSFGILNAVVSLAIFDSEFDILRNVLFISSFIIIILNGIIIWYVYTEKSYFKTKHLNKVTRAKDKFFVYVISVFLIVSILILITFGVDFYNTTLKTTDKLISELETEEIPELFCAQKSGEEQDLCYLILSIMRDGEDERICENIKSDFYKITCLRSLT